MSTTTRFIILSTVAMLTSSAALADGYYAKGYAGLSTLQGSDVTIDDVTSDLSYDGGITGGGAIGYAYPDSPFRAELEYTYRSGTVSDLGASVGSGGDFASTSLLLNGYYVFDTGAQFTPYVGAGIGYVTEIDFDVEDAIGADEFSETGLFGYQLMAGAEYPVTDQLAVFAEARYFSMDSPELKSESGGTLRADYDTLDIVTGVTWSF